MSVWRINKSVWFVMLIIAAAFLLYASPVEAAVISTDDTVAVGQNEVIDDDLYIFGDTITIDGTVLGDVVIVSREAVINGTVKGSLLAFAETIRINGSIEGTARGAANTVYLNGQTGRDLLIAANTISVSGDVGQDLLGVANSIIVTGSVGRNIKAGMSKLVIDAPVGGDVEVAVSELIINSKAVVVGNISYTSENEALVDAQAVISGSINREDPPSTAVTVSPGRKVWSFVRPVISLLAVSLLLVLLFPNLTAGVADTIRRSPGPSIGYGALLVFGTPLVALVLLISVIGIPISIAGVLLYGVLLYVSRIFTGYFLAQIFFDRLGKKLHPVWLALIGVSVLALLTKIPYVGWLVNLAAALIASGAFILYMAGQKNKLKTEELE